MGITSFTVFAICAAAVATTAKGDEFQEHTYMFSLTPGFSSFFTKDNLDMYIFSRTKGNVNITSSSVDKDVYTAHVVEKVGYGFPSIACSTMESTIDHVKDMCYVGAVYDDTQVYCNLTTNKDYPTKCASKIMSRNIYTFELTENGITSEGLEFIENNVLNTTGTPVFIDYSYVNEKIYFVGAAEKTEGEFGNALAKEFGEDAAFKNYVSIVKDGKGKVFFGEEESSSKNGVAAFVPAALSLMGLIF